MRITDVYLLAPIKDVMPEAELSDLAEFEGMDAFNLSRSDVYGLAILALESLAVKDTGGSHVTAVEDISLDQGARADRWLALADRLRAKVTEADSGPFTVEFIPPDFSSRGIEAAYG